MSTIKDLKCEYCVEPIGIDTEKPYLSWTIRTNELAVYQAEYRILVEQGERKIWDTGYIKTGKTYNIEYSGLALENLTKYNWKVFIKTTDGNFIESPYSFFITGFIDRTKMTGEWIEHPSFHDNPVFYGDFFVKKDVEIALAVVSGLGYYEMTLNGKRGHQTYNVPAWTDYGDRDLSGLQYPYEDNSKKRILYNVHDITNYLSDGINRFEFMLGNGFFNQVERLVEGNMSYGTPRIYYEIHVKYKDGSVTIIKSDTDTFCTDGPLEFNNIYFGEIKNDNIGMDFNGSMSAEICEWEPGELTCQYSYFDKITEIIEPVKLRNNIYDVGKGISGRVRIKARAPRGARFLIKYSEALDEKGLPDYGPTGGEWQIQSNEYIFGENHEIDYKETFGWRGFRYFVLEKDDDIDISSLTVEVITADVQDNGKLRTDNSTIQWIYDAYLNTQIANMHGGVPSDCPHRERLGYTGDGQVTAQSMLLATDSINFLRKWNKDIAFSQNSKTGFVPHTVPFGGGGGGPAWGSACAVIPAKIYESTFDERIIHESYKILQAWINYLEIKNPEIIVVREEEGSWCLGDWCMPIEGYDVEQVDLNHILKELPPELVNTAYYYHCVSVCINFADILNRDTTYYKRLAKRISDRFNKKFLNRENYRYANGKHLSNVYALYFDMVEKSDLQNVRDALVDQIKESGYSMDAGIFASSMLFSVLADAGRLDVIDKMLWQNDYPSFGYMKKSGSKNLWETWDGKASLNHPMFGGVVAFFYKYIAGIRFISKDNRILIEPVFLNSVNSFSIIQNSIYGAIGVRWEREGSKIKMSITLPGNTKGAFKYEETVIVIENGLTNLEFDEATGKPIKAER